MRLDEIFAQAPTTMLWRRSAIDKSTPYFFDKADVLYHGTTAVRAANIARDGLQPSLGAFTRSCYPRATLRPVVVAADANFKHNIMNAIRYHLAIELHGSADAIYEVTVSKVIGHGAVVEIVADRAKFQQATKMHAPQRGIETFDFYSFEPVRVDRVLTGQTLADWCGENLLTQHFTYG